MPVAISNVLQTNQVLSQDLVSYCQRIGFQSFGAMFYSLLRVSSPGGNIERQFCQVLLDPGMNHFCEVTERLSKESFFSSSLLDQISHFKSPLKLAGFALGHIMENMRSRADGTYLLTDAALRGNVKVVKFFVENKLDLDPLGRGGDTPLTAAAFKGNLETARLLIRGGAQVDTRDKIGLGGNTPLMISVFEGHANLAQLIAASGANLEIRNNDNDTALGLAVASGNDTIVGILIEAGAELNTTLKNGRTALSLAVECGHYKIVEALLNRNVGSDTQDKHGMTALMYAVVVNNFRMAKLLVDAGADMEIEKKELVNGKNRFLSARDLASLLEDKRISELFHVKRTGTKIREPFSSPRGEL